ncbi:MAG: cystathionine gamma-synthase [Candidatus Tectimicrobiota bacterium]|nr:MAG: cystathionine gamma-synthase [Candidatus Tectomicrobia bacterium]
MRAWAAGVVFLLVVGRGAGEAAPQEVARALLHLLDYLAVDYPATVRDGAVVDPEEYAEQQEFARQLLGQLERLPAEARREALRPQVEALVAAIDQRRPAAEVQALCARLSTALIAAYEVPVAPRRLPPLAAAPALFQQHCAACHGPQGFGDGPAAAALQPPPSNFHDRQRQQQRSVYSLYSTLTLGVAGTAMPAFTQLSDAERWALAFYVSNFFATEAERARGQRLWQQGRFRALFPDLAALTRATPAAVAARAGEEGVAVLAYLRAAPQQVLSAAASPLVVAQQQLAASLAAYRAGEVSRAYDLAVAAYLEGFELAEAGLRAVDAGLVGRIEAAMADYRQALRQGVAAEVLAARVEALQALLQQAARRLETGGLSPAAGFAGAFVVLLREGLEAVLILAAMVAFLRRVGRRDALRYVHAGWGAALLLGGLTWLAARSLVRVSGASREVTEGVAALLAAAVLVYVGCWLHNHAHAQRWQRFLQEKMAHTLGRGRLWGLALVAFVAVYREALETVLFYEALWLQALPAARSALLLGLGTAALALGGLVWLLLRYSVRLPLRRFFQVNAALLLALAVILAGRGVAALQEAGRLQAHRLGVPGLPWLGLYPTLEGLGVQLALVAAIGAVVWWQRRQG